MKRRASESERLARAGCDRAHGSGFDRRHVVAEALNLAFADREALHAIAEPLAVRHACNTSAA